MLKQLNTIKISLAILLAAIGGLAFIIKKIAKNASTSIVIPVAIGLVTIGMFWPLLFDCFSYRGCPSLSALFDNALVANVAIACGGFIFWKKGLEVALLYEIILLSYLRM